MADKPERNPFVLPSDEEVFRMRDAERRMKSVQRERQSQMKVWEKTTSAAQLGRSSKVSELFESAGGDLEHGASMKRSSVKSRSLVAAAKTVLGPEGGQRHASGAHKPEKENMAEFVAKKREMFLVQMSLDTKREEIRKLEEKAAMKEDALKKSEQMLEEDAIRFDTFLKENDKKAHDAIKMAERETKLKHDKVGEIKRLNQAIQAVQSDISKHRESLEDCLRFKRFLDGLTPKEFFDDQKQRKRSRQEARRLARVKARLVSWERLKAEKSAEFEARKVSEHASLLAKGMSKKKAASTVAAMRAPKMPTSEPVDEDEAATSSGAEYAMFFTQPRQLVDIFTQLEEQNLFLIQNSQETEQALEDLRATFKQTRVQMTSSTSALQGTISELEGLINVEDGKSKALLARVTPNANQPPQPPSKGGALPGAGAKGAGAKAAAASATGALPMKEQQAALAGLHAKVYAVYKKCGFDVSGGSPVTLFMLSELEARLEDLLAAMGLMPDEYVVKAEKSKDKQRRDRKRLEVQQEQERLQEKRNRESAERSMMAPKKRTGRQVMSRSKPLGRKSIAEEKESVSQEELDEIKFFSGE